MSNPEPSPIRWRQVSEYGLVSQCDRFRIGKYRAVAVPYAAWNGYALLGRYLTADDARRACQEALLRSPDSKEKAPTV